MVMPLKVNERCLVRHQDCRRILGGSRICFVACPNSEEVALELEIIRQRLRDVNIEPYIATDQRDYQKDIFCEKICTKIIESHFCIVILNDVKDVKDKVVKPNANVYYEYGLMTAFRKKIIPVQLHNHDLAFNIQSLDTLKYTPVDFSDKIEEAIKMTLINVEEESAGEQGKKKYIDRDWTLDLIGLVRIEDRFKWRHLRVLSTRTLNFEPYIRPKDGGLFFVASFEEEDTEKDILLRSKIITLRIQNYSEQIIKEIEQLEEDSNRYKDADRTNYILDQKAEREKTLNQLRSSTVLILAGQQKEVEGLAQKYNKAVGEEVFKLNFEVMDDRKVRELLSKT